MKKVFFVFIIFTLFLFVFSCEFNPSPTPTPKEDDEIVGIEIDKTNISDKMTFDFDITKVNLFVFYEDKTENVPITLDMINDKNYNKIGEHDLTVSYEGFSDTITYEICFAYAIRFMCEGEELATYQVLEGDSLKDVELPERSGWFADYDADLNNIDHSFDVEVSYIQLVLEDLSVIENTLASKYQNLELTEDLHFDKYVGGARITYSSSNQSILTDTGHFDRPYVESNLTLSCIIDYDGEMIKRTYNLSAKGYKSLNNGIASGYVYSGYGSLTQEFFDTMDIIYCAFVRVDVNGGFTGMDATGDEILGSNKAEMGKIDYYMQKEAKKQGIYIVASLGGGGSAAAQTFARIASSDTLRKQFAKNVVKFINEYDLDGIDIDWETPSSANSTNFTLMMKELYTAVKANNPNHLVTAAIGGGKWAPPKYDLTNSTKYLDYVNVMTYNMCTGSGYYHNALYPATTNHNSTYNCGKTLSSCSIDESLTIYKSYGVSPSKLIFGLAFYGMSQAKSGTSWKGGTTTNQDSIAEFIKSGNYNYYFDERCGVPYLVSKDGKSFISYEDTRSVLVKCEYIYEKGCAGLMYWENGQDLTGELVHAMNIGLNK